MPTYLKYIYSFLHFELRSEPEPDSDPIFFSQMSQFRIKGKILGSPSLKKEQSEPKIVLNPLKKSTKKAIKKGKERER